MDCMLFLPFLCNLIKCSASTIAKGVFLFLEIISKGCVLESELFRQLAVVCSHASHIFNLSTFLHSMLYGKIEDTDVASCTSTPFSPIMAGFTVCSGVRSNIVISFWTTQSCSLLAFAFADLVRIVKYTHLHPPYPL